MMLFDEMNLFVLKVCGVKLFVYYGMGDLVFLFNDMCDWYVNVMQVNGGDVLNFVCFYLVLGMNYCLGGLVVDQFDMLMLFVVWVEQGQVLVVIVVVVCDMMNVVLNVDVFVLWGVGCMWLLCLYLQVVCYNGLGDVNLVVSFSCC